MEGDTCILNYWTLFDLMIFSIGRFCDLMICSITPRTKNITNTVRTLSICNALAVCKTRLVGIKVVKRWHFSNTLGRFKVSVFGLRPLLNRPNVMHTSLKHERLQLFFWTFNFDIYWLLFTSNFDRNIYGSSLDLTSNNRIEDKWMTTWKKMLNLDFISKCSYHVRKNNQYVNRI